MKKRKNRSDPNWRTLLSFVFAVLAIAAPGFAADRRPNIVFILADDLGWRDLSGEGSRYYESPNIDRISEEGMRFTQGYAACQVCSPSRASIMTGKYTPRHGITDWIGARTGEAWRRQGRHTPVLPPDYEWQLRDSEVTLAEALREAGYRTFFAGKWHLGGDGSLPEDHGFDVNKGGWRVGGPAGGYFAPYKNPKLKNGPNGESLPVRLGQEAARFIDESKDEPFFAYLSFYSVHSPIQTTHALWAKYREKAVRAGVPGSRFLFDRRMPVRQVQDCPIYAGMIESMDDAVGIVLDALKRNGLEENTIVCFTSDNGGVSAGDAKSTSNMPLRGGKGRQWEGGIREPYYVKAPGVTRPGSTCDLRVSGIDFYPTLLELAGLSVPAEQTVDGMSLVPLLKGERSASIESRDLFWHYPHYGNQGGEPSSIIRRGNWKLIHYFEDGRDELYNLKNDPGEQNDVVQQNADLARNLRKDLDAWLAATNAQLPVRDPKYDDAAFQAWLKRQQTTTLQQLEKQHAGYLREDWQPNKDWWGSAPTRD
ncbi:MAG: sulfatase [Pirellulaceae bacterium]